MKKTVITHLIGGLGNQLFQYAVGMAAAVQNGALLRIDARDFAWYRRPYFLDSFQISAPPATRWDHIEMTAWSNHRSPLVRFDQRRPIRKRLIRKDPRLYAYAPELMDLGDRSKMFLIGYWQNERYFASIRDRLKKEFRLKPEISVQDTVLGKAISSSESVAVHLRRGDSIAKGDPKNPIPYQGLVSEAYIATAMELVRRQRPHAEFFLFSDEVDWARENFALSFPVTYVPAHLTDVQQFELMALCKHQVTANSTFSWWAAWLNDNPDKIVCTPKQWDARNPGLDISELIPSSWHII